MREFRCLAEYGIESSANLLNTEWGVGSGEWGVFKCCFPTQHF
ncbi:hypothetical protein GXM_03506 [Nostoc sphaeroides CCNUC1]|uniref:Uncharacterized protein n=1 Tax=Nostoc sphaeroides CCNUC1 TaxID=2653204 RepID=A0A5P8W190_9NOSO|nr:hypothetical protein GXM_03506 [Nostoc sphaeroides CCNUC1]